MEYSCVVVIYVFLVNCNVKPFYFSATITGPSIFIV
uniref:Uncharacterized protein n=1 Tax=Anguilla anguilla TaxID=7936 RepID=A0A0E9PLP8_ANGAN